MSVSAKSLLENLPLVTSLDELYSVATILGRNSANAFESLAEEMATTQNPETARMLKGLAVTENAQIEFVAERAYDVGAKVDAHVEGLSFGQDLRSDLARENADNTYLLTPYRAIQLAVISKERVFEILSTIAGKQEDAVVRQHAEELARRILSEISELRLHRRRASRSEVKTAVQEATHGAVPADMKHFASIVETIHAIIRTITVIIRDTWAPTMTGNTKSVLQGLLEDFSDFPDAVVADDEWQALKAKIRQDNDSLFPALTFLLRELESASDLFLYYAEKSGSEEIANASQVKAARYISRITKIRDELDLHLSK